jgi:hypothetical protein
VGLYFVITDSVHWQKGFETRVAKVVYNGEFYDLENYFGGLARVLRLD